MKRSKPALPESTSLDYRPFTVRKPVEPQWSSSTTTQFSNRSVPSLKFREPLSVTGPATRSTASPYSVPQPSSPIRPQPPSLSSPTRPKPTVNPDLTRPDQRSAPEQTPLSRPLPKEIGVSSVSGPSERPQYVPQERSVGDREQPETYRVSGVNRSAPPVPFQVSGTSPRPGVPSVSPVTPARERAQAATTERTLPNRVDVGRPEPPSVVSFSAPDRAEPTPLSTQKGGNLGEYRSGGLTPPKQRAASIGGTGPSRTMSVRSLRVSDL